AITDTAPASSAIFACSAFVTSMITPPLSISAKPVFNRKVPVCSPLPAASDILESPGFVLARLPVRALILCNSGPAQSPYSHFGGKRERNEQRFISDLGLPFADWDTFNAGLAHFLRTVLLPAYRLNAYKRSRRSL